MEHAAIVCTLEGASLMEKAGRTLELRVYDTGYDRNECLHAPFIYHLTGKIRKGKGEEFEFSAEDILVAKDGFGNVRRNPIGLFLTVDRGWLAYPPDDGGALNCYGCYSVELLSAVTGAFRAAARGPQAAPVPSMTRVPVPARDGRHKCARYEYCGNYILDAEDRNVCYECNCD